MSSFKPIRSEDIRRGIDTNRKIRSFPDPYEEARRLERTKALADAILQRLLAGARAYEESKDHPVKAAPDAERR